MSDVPSEDEHPDKQPDSPVIKELREKAEKADDAERRAQTAERKLLLHEAGLTALTDKQQKAVLDAHEGDWTAEALKATAADFNFAKPQDEPKVPAAEFAAHARVAEAANGTPEPPTDLDTAIANAQTSAELDEILKQAGMLSQQ